MTGLERGLATAARWLLPALVLSLPLLLIDVGTDPLALTTVHLSIVTVLIYALSLRLSEGTRAPWFSAISSRFWSWFATAAAAAALVTGVAALTMLASSGALRYDVSLQFLQLLSALDIAWVVAATVIGFRWIWNVTAARIAGAIMSVICVWSIWRYLDEVGFTPEGGWLVSGEALMRLVIPSDTVAALVAVGSVVVGVRRQLTAQPMPQS